jgi:serine/threonine protein kinase/tetratricopeptide (TPR) repeat protein
MAITGRMLGNYEILSRLAQGGMGEILLARQRGPGGFERLVIVKTLLQELTAQQDFLDQFLDEARLLANLSHPNVVATLELGLDGAAYFLAMEFIRGINLHALQELLTQRGMTFPARVTASIIRDTALGLAHAHSAVGEDGKPLGIVHRDISPHNIMVRLDGLVKVVDFGLARAAVRSTRTAAGVVKGKFRYMAPEQLMERPVDARTDEFALGIVAWEMLTGQPLFTGEGPGEAFAAILNQEIIPPSQLVADVPPELEAVIMRMLRRDPDARFSRCEEVARALRDYLSRQRTPPEDEVAELVGRLARERIVATVRQATAPKPSSKATCPGCGAEVTPDARFCPQCGTRLDTTGGTTQPPGPAASARLPTPPAPAFFSPGTLPTAAPLTRPATPPLASSSPQPSSSSHPAQAPLPHAAGFASLNGAPPLAPYASGVPAPVLAGGPGVAEAPRAVTMTNNPVVAAPDAPQEPLARGPVLLQDGLLDAISGRYDAPPPKGGEEDAIDVSLSQVSVQLEVLEKSGRFRPVQWMRPSSSAPPSAPPPEPNVHPQRVLAVYVNLQGVAELNTFVGDRAPALQEKLLALYAGLCNQAGAAVVAHNANQCAACFGLSGLKQVDALRAVRLGRALQAALDAFNKDNGTWCTMTVAIHGGAAAVAVQPDLHHLPPLAPVGQARLLAQSALAGSLLVDVHTARCLGGRVRVEGDSVMVANPGQDAPLEAVRVVGIVEGPTLVGRTSEATLAAGLAASPPAGLAGVLWTASPGLGRTALLLDAARTALEGGALTAQAHGGLEDPASSHTFARALVRNILDASASTLPMAPSATPVDICRALGLEAGLAEAVGAWLAALPFPPGITAGVARIRLEAALARVLRTASRLAPLWLLLDDLHLADADSVELLGTVLGRVTNARVVVMATSAADVPALPRVLQRVPLRALADDATYTLAQQLGADASWARTFTSRVAGNPGLLRLLCAWLRRAGQGGTLQKPQDALQSLPAAANAFPRWLLGTLSQSGAQVACHAAVMGMQVHLLELERVMGAGALKQAAAEVVDAGILVPGDNADTLRFGHAFLRLGLLSALPPQELANARGALAAVLAQREHDSDAHERALVLRGPDHADLQSLQAAAQSNAARTCHNAAVALWGRAVTQAAKHARLTRDPTLVLAALTMTRELVALWRHVAAADAVKLLPRLVTDLAPPPSEAYAEAVAEHVRALLALGRVDEADTWLDRTLEALPEQSDPESRATLLALLADVAFVRGDAEGAVMQLTSAFQVIGGRATRDPLFYAQHLLALAAACARGGRAKESREYLVHAARQAALAGSRALEGAALHALATSQEAANEVTEATQTAGQAAEAFDAAGQLLGWATAAELHARMLMRQGEAEPAADVLGRVVEAYQDLGQTAAADRVARMRSSATARGAPARAAR